MYSFFKPSPPFTIESNPYNYIDELLHFPLTMQRAFEMKWLDKYPINDIASSLVRRLHLQREKSRVEATETYFENIELRLCFPGHIVNNLIKSGEFLNTHQTGTSCGVGGEKRAIIEAFFLDLPFELFKDTVDLDYRDDPRLHFCALNMLYVAILPNKICSIDFQLYNMVILRRYWQIT